MVTMVPRSAPRQRLRGRREAAATLLLSILALASLAPATAPAAEVGATLLRTTLIVSDIEQSLAFYALLGLKPEEELGGARDPGKSPFPLAAASKRSRLVILASADRAGGRIGILSFDDPQPPLARTAHERVGRGDMVFVFDVADAEAVHARLVKASAQVVEPPQVFESRKTDAAGRPYQGKVFHVFDPDGNLIELLQAATPRR